jgi:hypothetical protein
LAPLNLISKQVKNQPGIYQLDKEGIGVYIGIGW